MHLGHDDARLSAFLDDELDERAALAVTHHVARCGSCRDELEALRATRSALRGLPTVEAPLSFMVESVLLGPDDARHGPPAAAVALVVVASLLLVAAFALGGGPGEVSPDVETLVGDHVETVGGGPVVVPVVLDR